MFYSPYLSSLEDHLESMVGSALSHSMLTMCVTSFTTAAAFFASFISTITAIKCFRYRDSKRHDNAEYYYVQCLLYIVLNLKKNSERFRDVLNRQSDHYVNTVFLRLEVDLYQKSTSNSSRPILYVTYNKSRPLIVVDLYQQLTSISSRKQLS